MSATARWTAGSIGPGGVPKRPITSARSSSTIVEVAARGEDVEQRLRGEHLADRRGERRPADLGADQVELLEHLLEAVAGALRAQRRVDAGDEAGGQVVLRGADGDARRERRDGLVADVLVDEVGRLPERCDVDAGVEAHARERLARAPRRRRGAA